jgi:ribosomal protein L40E
MRKRLFLAVLAITFFVPFVAKAQANVALASLDVNLWLEYDKPEALVIEYITLAKDTALPTTLELRIPAAANVHTVAIGATLDEVSDQNVDYSVKLEGEWRVVSIQAVAPAIQFEYYDPNLTKDGAERYYNYQWTGDYAVGAFSITLQAPIDSSNVKTFPLLENAETRADGLTYYRSDFGSLALEEFFSQEINYSKKTDTLSVSARDTGGSDGSEFPAALFLEKYLLYIIGGAGALLLLGALIYYWRAEQKPISKPRRRHGAAEVQEQSQVERYCHKCGARTEPSDRFCRTCGVRVRRENED